MHEGPHPHPPWTPGRGSRACKARRSARSHLAHMLARLRPYTEGAEKLRGGSEVVHAGIALRQGVYAIPVSMHAHLLPIRGDIISDRVCVVCFADKDGHPCRTPLSVTCITSSMASGGPYFTLYCFAARRPLLGIPWSSPRSDNKICIGFRLVRSKPASITHEDHHASGARFMLMSSLLGRKTNNNHAGEHEHPP